MSHLIWSGSGNIDPYELIYHVESNILLIESNKYNHRDDTWEEKNYWKNGI